MRPCGTGDSSACDVLIRQTQKRKVAVLHGVVGPELLFLSLFLERIGTSFESFQKSPFYWVTCKNVKAIERLCRAACRTSIRRRSWAKMHFGVWWAMDDACGAAVEMGK